jgi:hypothetical protein
MSTEEKKEVTSTLPKQIIICRHIDKVTTGKHKDDSGGSKKGLARANYLADFFLTSNPCFNRPDMIYAFSKKKEDYNRSIQAMTPLFKIGQYKPEQFNTQYNDSEGGSQKMIDSLFSPTNAGKTLLLCWEHTILPEIVREIGKRLNPDKHLFKDFKVWNINPTKGKDDTDLYSMVVIINVETSSLIGINQSNDFTVDDSELRPDKKSYTHILYKM